MLKLHGFHWWAMKAGEYCEGHLGECHQLNCSPPLIYAKSHLTIFPFFVGAWRQPGTCAHHMHRPLSLPPQLRMFRTGVGNLVSLAPLQWSCGLASVGQCQQHFAAGDCWGATSSACRLHSWHNSAFPTLIRKSVTIKAVLVLQF